MAEQAGASQQFVDIKEIREGMVILKDGSLRAVLECSAINFALKSAEEQNAIVFQFQNFLNSLDFPLQIVIQSRNLDITPYIQYLESLIPQQRNELLKLQAQDYIQFIKSFVELQNIMAKRFLVVVPMPRGITEKLKPGGLKAFLPGKKPKEEKEEFSEEEFQRLRNQLLLRVEQVMVGLRNVQIAARMLDSQAALSLLASLYNPSRVQKELPQPGTIAGYQ